MNEFETISWIFLSTAFASEQEPANFESISQIADGNKPCDSNSQRTSNICWVVNEKWAG